MHPQLNNAAAASGNESEDASIQIGPFGWDEAVRILLAAHLFGTSKGRREAAAHIERMAQVADLAQDAVSAINKLPTPVLESLGEEWTRLRESVLTNAGHLSLDIPLDGAPQVTAQVAPSKPRRLGLWAKRYGRELELAVYESAEGFYLGTYDEDGPFSRESEEYWPSREQALRALESGQWTQRRSL